MWQRISQFNEWLAIQITNVVATMWCAYAFALLALISLPDAIKGGAPTLIAWIAQTFLQLVLLSIIMVGQKVGADHHEAHAEKLDRIEDSLEALHKKCKDSIAQW
jgi:hypothetical protein